MVVWFEFWFVVKWFCVVWVCVVVDYCYVVVWFCVVVLGFCVCGCVWFGFWCDYGVCDL